MADAQSLEHVQSPNGDTIGRDQFNIGQVVSQAAAIGEGAEATVNYYIQQALSAVDEAERARLQELQRLAESVRDYARRLAAIAADTGDANDAGPYRGLIAYSLADAELFFGRDRAIADLLRTMQAGRLTVLQSESGAGKTSLLHAGIAPRLLAEHHLPVIVRPYDLSPGLKIKRTLLPSLEQAPALAAASLLDFLRNVTEILGQSTTLYLILDQFEEFFTVLLDETLRRAFVADLAACLDDAALNVRWVLALRSEFFGDLATLRPQIRNPFQNDYRLNRLTADEARDVITNPVAHFDLTYDAVLVDQLIQDLRQPDGQIAPAQIQLVCRALYNAYLERKATTPSMPARLDRELYKAEGEAQGILRNHLNRVLRQALPTPAARELARLLLINLISSDQRRLRRTQSDLAQQLAVGVMGGQSLQEVLDSLVEQRLVLGARSDEDDEATYELAHDYLVQEIQLDPEEQARKIAQELLDQEVETWLADSRSPIGDEKLLIIEEQGNRLRMNENAAKLIQLSKEAIGRRKRTVRYSYRAAAVALLVAVIAGILASILSSRVRDAQQKVIIANETATTVAVERSTVEAQVTESAQIVNEANRQLSAISGTATAVVEAQATAIAEAQYQTRLRAATAAVGQLEIQDHNGRASGKCSAALISDRYILTVDYCTAIGSTPSLKLKMGYFSDDLDVREYDVDPNPVEISPEFGYAILRVIGNPALVYGTLPLRSRAPQREESAYIVGYIEGGPLAVSRRENCRIVSEITEREFLLDHPEGNSCIRMPGAGGAPVFSDNDYRLLGIYNSWVPDPETTETLVPKALRITRLDTIFAQSAVLQSLTDSP